MAKVTCGVGISLDGYMAGPHQSEQHPMGEIEEHILHRWMFEEPEMHKAEMESLVSAGAYIMGKNMFVPPDRRSDTTWKGWWGDTPPYHGHVFVLTHTKQDPIEMLGGTTFYFVTEGIDAAFEVATKAANGKDISIAGGAHTIDQYLVAGKIDELWLHIAPVTIGAGERLFEGVPNLRLEPIETRTTKLVTHVKYNVIK
jgi:dihydrofolate reductase